MSLYGSDRVASHAGRSKYFTSEVTNDYPHFMFPGGSVPNQKAQKQVEEIFGFKREKEVMVFSFGEPKPLGLSNTAFNVLYVQTVKPGWMSSPIFRVLARTVREAWELVEPVFRFGLPANSIRDKCPYWREDSSFLTVTNHMNLQKVTKSYATGALEAGVIAAVQPKSDQHSGGAKQLEKFMWPWQRKQQQEKEGMQHAANHSHGHGHGHGHGHVQSFLISHPPTWFAKEFSVQWVAAINVALWVALATSGGNRGM